MLSVFFGIAVLIALMNYQVVRAAWPVARGRIEATWPMGPGHIEGFANMTLSQWLPSPEVLTKPAGTDCPTVLENAAPFEGAMAGLYKSFDLVGDYIPGKPEPRVAMGPTSQQCYEVDWARGLERAGSYAQRTNNYIHGYPDSCSAPNHDLILDFYKEKPMSAPYQV